MEEDIWEIENNIDMFMDTLYENYRQSAVKPFEKAIENLMERNKDLKMKIEALGYCINENTNLLEKKDEATQYVPYREIKDKDFVSKVIKGEYPNPENPISIDEQTGINECNKYWEQKVKEKIEEIEMIKKIDSSVKYTHLELLQYGINQLQELLD